MPYIKIFVLFQVPAGGIAASPDATDFPRHSSATGRSEFPQRVSGGGHRARCSRSADRDECPRRTGHRRWRGACQQRLAGYDVRPCQTDDAYVHSVLLLHTTALPIRIRSCSNVLRVSLTVLRVGLSFYAQVLQFCVFQS